MEWSAESISSLGAVGGSKARDKKIGVTDIYQILAFLIGKQQRTLDADRRII